MTSPDPRTLILALSALPALVAVAAVGLSGAAFTSTTANPGNSLGAAASFCSAPGTVASATAAADTFVDQASPSSNFGTASDLFIQSKSSGNRRTLLRFNLPAAPQGCSVTGADLRVYATAAIGGRTLQAYRAAAPWGETTATWNNQPATTGSATTSASGSSPGWQIWQVTDHVQAMYAGVNNGFVLRDGSESAGTSPEQKYQSREGSINSQDPTLVVTFG
jgi:hypothetical protein